MNRRSSGVLLHLTSLPSPFGIGDLGPDAYRFVDFLRRTRQSYWQILPVGPTDPMYDNSPYHSISAFAGNPNLISPALLAEDGLLDPADLEMTDNFSLDRVSYRVALRAKTPLLLKAAGRFMEKGITEAYKVFSKENAAWLDDYALFVALNRTYQAQWIAWPEGVKLRDPQSLAACRKDLGPSIEKEKVLQFFFFKQWFALKRYCLDQGVQIIGDIPIYLDFDSADLWSHPEYFKLDHEMRPYVKAGVPPDYFSKTGQLWGNPIYNWDLLKKQEFSWWVKRIAHNLTLYDWLRVDHFRGLVAYWEVPAAEKTAMNGQWVEAPIYDLFYHLRRKIPLLPLIAEDLGLITPDVREAIRRLGLPGMKILLFAFGWDMSSNPYILHNMEKGSIAYTGTHDNNTVRGWFEKEASFDDRERLFRYLGRSCKAEEVSWEFIRLVMMSRADTAIFPMQDLLGLGQEARMNIPSVETGNWRWRLNPGLLTPDLEKRLHDMTWLYGRE
ncbi:MAG: 4-alpha-glucanotransferase [Planctomycetota bacterium]